MMLTRWEQSFIDQLAELKGRGYEFEAAWTMALAIEPPSARARRADWECPSHVDFLYQACFDAWHGLRPTLAQLPAIMAGAFEPADGIPARNVRSRGPGIRMVA